MIRTNAPAAENPHTASSLSGKEFYAFGLGGVAVQMSYHATHYLANPIYNVLLGVSPLVISNVFAIGQLITLVLTPLFAPYADNFSSRWGRRKPFLLIGGVPVIVAFVLWFFYPANWSVGSYSTYFTILTVVASVFGVFWYTSFNSLLPEVAAKPQERVSLLGVRLQLCTLFLFLTAWCMPFAQSRLFNDVRQGLQVYGACMTLVLVVGLYMSAFVLKERYVVRRPRSERLSTIEAFRQTLKIKPMYPLLIATLALGLAGNLVAAVGYYLVVFYARNGDIVDGNWFVSAQGTAWLVSIMILTKPGVKLCEKWGRKKVFALCMTIMLSAAALKYLCYFSGSGYLLLIPNIIVGPAYSIAGVVLMAEAADLTDWDELKTHRRREAVVMTPINWLTGFSLAIAAAAPGYILASAGFSVELGAQQSPDVFPTLMRWFVWLPFACVVVAVVAHHYFPLKESDVIEIKRQLAARRAGSTPTN